ncbi:MAG: hypothetical protein PWP09_1705 [Thermotogota bacterium]|nr:hypothetical protein [Thermotogota bacterium]
MKGIFALLIVVLGVANLFFSEPLIFEYPVEVVFKTIENGGVLPAVLPIPSGDSSKEGFKWEFSPSIFSGEIPNEIPQDRYSKPLDPADNFYIFEEAPPFAMLSFEMGDGPFSLHAEYPLRREFLAFHSRSEANAPFVQEPPYISVDLNFPQKAYGVFKWDNQYLVIGRCKLKWGDWKYPVSLSNVSPYFDNLTYSYRSKAFQYSFHLISINPVLTDTEEASQSTVIPLNSDPLAPYFERVKTLVAHRVDMFPMKGMRLGIGEMTMIGGKVPDLFTLSPFSVYHNNFNEAYTNSIGVFDFSWTVLRGLNLYGELVLDDLVVPLTESPDSKPTAYALNFGVTKTVPLGIGRMILGLEYALATDWVYNAAVPYLKFYNRVSYLSNFPPSRNIVDYPIGFAYGPDSSLVSLTATFFNERSRIEVEFFHLKRGPRSIHSEYKKESSGETKTFRGFSVVFTQSNLSGFMKWTEGNWRSGIIYRWTL